MLAASSGFKYFGRFSEEAFELPCFPPRGFRGPAGGRGGEAESPLPALSPPLRGSLPARELPEFLVRMGVSRGSFCPSGHSSEK